MYPFNDEQDNFMPYVRRRGIFASPDIKPSFDFDIPSAIEEENKPSELAPASSFEDIYRKVSEMMKPGPAATRYRQFLETEQPVREQFKPTKMQRLASVLTGVSEGLQRGGPTGFAAGQSVLDEPYRTALENYKLQSDRLAKSANIESLQQKEETKVFWDALRDELDRKKLEEESRLHTSQIRKNEAQAEHYGRPSLSGSTWTNTESGIRQGVQYNPETKRFETVNFGLAGPTREQRILEAGQLAAARAGATDPIIRKRMADQNAFAWALRKLGIQGQKDIRLTPPAITPTTTERTQVEIPGGVRTTTNRFATPETVWMRDPNGKEGPVPLDQKDAALAEGYVEVPKKKK